MNNPINSILSPLIENLSEGIVYQNLNGEIIYANAAAATILGLTHEQLIGKKSVDPGWRAIKEDYTDFPGNEHPAMMALKTSLPQYNIIMGVHQPDDSVCWVKINSHPVFDNKGELEAAITSYADITKQIQVAEKLRLSEQNQKAILSSVNEGFYLVNNDYKIIAINNAAIELHQKIYKEYRGEGENILGLFPENRIDYVKQSFEKAFGGEKTEYEVTYNVDGRDTWLNVAYNPVMAKGKQIEFVCVGINDITERKFTEQLLLDSERRFRMVLSRLGDNMWEHNFETGKTEFSEWINELTAYRSDILNDNVDFWWNSVHENDRGILTENDRKYKSGLIDHHSVEYRVFQKGGAIRWVLDRGVVIEKDTAGNPLKIIGTHTDITERKNIEENIIANERKFRAIFNSTFQFMGLMTTEGILIEANKTATDFFGLPKEEVLGMNFIDSRWFSDATREKSKQALAKAAIGETVTYELELHMLDGRDVVIDFSIRPIFDTKGNVILLIPEGKDITEKLRMEKEIERERVNKQKEILLASIEGQEKQRREVSRELHDNINQVLATVKIYLQLAGENESMRDGLIKKCYENISHAIEEVRKLSKALAPPTLEDISLSEAVQQMVNDMMMSGLFEIDFADDNFNENLLDNSQKMTIYRVVQEQFTNIMKYARTQSINIILATSKNKVLLTVKDNGIGFDTSTRSTGTGIKNMRSRVESQSGEFSLTSSPGKGCTLKITLPLIKPLTNEKN